MREKKKYNLYIGYFLFFCENNLIILFFRSETSDNGRVHEIFIRLMRLVRRLILCASRTRSHQTIQEVIMNTYCFITYYHPDTQHWNFPDDLQVWDHNSCNEQEPNTEQIIIITPSPLLNKNKRSHPTKIHSDPPPLDWCFAIRS